MSELVRRFVTTCWRRAESPEIGAEMEQIIGIRKELESIREAVEGGGLAGASRSRVAPAAGGAAEAEGERNVDPSRGEDGSRVNRRPVPQQSQIP